jgi:hypothetical protein
LNPGDVVTVRYASSENGSDLEIYEIEKGGNVILDSSSKRLLKIVGFIFALGAVLLLLKGRAVLTKK